MIVLVDPALDGERLDRACTALLHGVAELREPASRSSLTRWIKEGRVEVNGSVVRDPSARARAGDRVVIDPAPPPSTDALPEDLAIEVLHADDDLVVVNKAAGMVVHPAAGHPRGTLVNALLFRFGTLASAPTGGSEEDSGAEGAADETDDAGPGLVRPGIVHRLDRWTSGVMVVARTILAREGLMAQLAAHTVERAYLAIVEGEPPARARYETLHGRHPSDRKRFTGRVVRGKRAVTEVEVVERLAGAALVRCRLETGRTHQIRVHLSEAGFPLLGDPVYGRTPRSARLREAAAALTQDAPGRQALHAGVLGLVHPRSTERLRFEAALPADMASLLARLRSSR